MTDKERQIDLGLTGVIIVRPVWFDCSTSFDKRPTQRSKEVLRAAVISQLDEIKKVSGGGSEDDIISEWTQALDWSHTAYEVCKRLDDKFHYAIDDDIMELACGLLDECFDVSRLAQKWWIAARGIKPKFQVGDFVKYKSMKGVVDGEIISINSETGEYHLFVESEGHVKSGLGVHSWVIPWESIITQSEVL